MCCLFMRVFDALHPDRWFVQSPIQHFHEFLDIERLGQVIGYARGRKFFDLSSGRIGADHDNRNGGAEWIAL
jgi:hypothetical protein